MEAGAGEGREVRSRVKRGSGKPGKVVGRGGRETGTTRRRNSQLRRRRAQRKTLREKDADAVTQRDWTTRGTQADYATQLLFSLATEKGTQLSGAEGRLLAEGRPLATDLRPPARDYTTVKLCAEFLEAQAATEKVGRTEGRRAALLHVLGSLSRTWVPGARREALEEGGRVAGLELSEEGRKGLRTALERIPKAKLTSRLEKAVEQGELLSLREVSELMYHLGKGLGTSEEALEAQLEYLATSQSEEEPVLARVDLEYYRNLILTSEGTPASGHHALRFVPLLVGEGMAEIRATDGMVALMGQMTEEVRESVPEDWVALKVLAVLYDVLAHLPELERHEGGRELGSRHQLRALGALNKTFMATGARKYVMRLTDSGVGHNLDPTDLRMLVELSWQSKGVAGTETRGVVAAAAQRIQVAILENALMSLGDLARLFAELGVGVMIPQEELRLMLRQCVREEMLEEEEIPGILQKLGPQRLVRMEDVARQLRVIVELRADGLVSRSRSQIHLSKTTETDTEEETSSEEEEESSSGESGESSEEEDEATPGQTAAAMELVPEYIRALRLGQTAGETEINTEGYGRAAGQLELEGTANTGPPATALACIRSALKRRRHMPPVELQNTLHFLGRQPNLDASALAKLLASLRDAALLTPDQETQFRNTVAASLPTSIANIIPHLHDAAISS